MATRAVCGFELNSALAEGGGGALSGTASLVTSPTAGSWSTYALRCNPTAGGVGYFNLWNHSATTGFPNFNETCGTTSYIRFKFRANTIPASGSEQFLKLVTAAFVNKFSLKLNSTGQISCLDTSGNIQTGTAVLSSGTWYRIEVKIGSGAGGVIEWKIDGTTDLTTTGTLNANAGAQTIYGSDGATGADIDFFFDDIAVSDSAYPGDGGVMLLIPDANGTYQDFSIGAGSGSHYQVVGVVPPSITTSYLVSSAQNQTETENMQPSSAKPISSTINCVLPLSYLRRNASTTTGKVRLISGGNNFDGSSVSVGSTAVCYGIPYDTDPNTGSAWTTSGIDSLQVGCVDDNASNRLRIGGAFLTVDAVVAAVPVNTVAPAVTGTAQVGQTLTTTNGTWTNTPTSYSYLWKHGDGSAAAATATNSTYVPVAGDIGFGMQCFVTASNAGGPGSAAGSNTTSNVLPAVPVNSVIPAITGTAQVGQTLTSSTGTWSNTPTSYTYQWQSNGSNVGANQNTYVPVTGDIGHTITCTVTASNAGGSGTPATSNATSAVIDIAPVADFTGTPTTGTAPLSVAFTYAGTGGTPTSYLWEKNSGSGWGNFSSTPTAQNPTESFAAGTWSVRVTATNTGGSNTKTQTNYITANAPLTAGSINLLLLGVG